MRGARRGGVGLGAVIVLVIVQLAVVGAVVCGGHDQGLTARRLDSARALYAAEAGANMAMRELMLNADEDGDGVVGSVSDDDDDSSDPALGLARFVVTKSEGGGVTTIVSTGRSGAARRSIQVVLN